MGILKNVVRDKRGVEIGGPSKGLALKVYQTSRILDNVVFSKDTVWCKQNKKFNYLPGKKGKVIINDAVNINKIGDEVYDFCFSSHCLEHIANPLKAIKEWLRIVKDKGYIIIIVPEKSLCFDHKREYSKFSTLLSQYEKDVGEDDLSTLPEILEKHDLSKDRKAGNLQQFTKRSLDNFNNRCLHHYVYDHKLLKEICDYFNCKFIHHRTQGIHRLFIMQKLKN